MVAVPVRMGWSVADAVGDAAEDESVPCCRSLVVRRTRSAVEVVRGTVSDGLRSPRLPLLLLLLLLLLSPLGTRGANLESAAGAELSGGTTAAPRGGDDCRRRKTKSAPDRSVGLAAEEVGDAPAPATTVVDTALASAGATAAGDTSVAGSPVSCAALSSVEGRATAAAAATAAGVRCTRVPGPDVTLPSAPLLLSSCCCCCCCAAAVAAAAFRNAAGSAKAPDDDEEREDEVDSSSELEEPPRGRCVRARPALFVFNFEAVGLLFDDAASLPPLLSLSLLLLSRVSCLKRRTPIATPSEEELLI